MNRREMMASAILLAGTAAIPFRGYVSAQVSATPLKFMMSDGVTLVVRHQGNGPSVLLVHGASGSHLSFARLVPLLTPSFATYALDRRGYGDSGGRAAHSLPREAEDIAAVIDALPAPVFVFAHSSGAVETLEALLLTKKAAAAILYEPPLTAVGASSPQPVCSLVATGQMEEALITFYKDYVRLPAPVLSGIQKSPAWPVEVSGAPALCNELTALSAYRFDAGRYAEISTHTVFLLGDQSPLFMITSVKSGVAAVPGARLQMLAGQGHGALAQAPEMIASVITREFSA